MTEEASIRSGLRTIDWNQARLDKDSEAWIEAETRRFASALRERYIALSALHPTGETENKRTVALVQEGLDSFLALKVRENDVIGRTIRQLAVRLNNVGIPASELRAGFETMLERLAEAEKEGITLKEWLDRE